MYPIKTARDAPMLELRAMREMGYKLNEWAELSREERAMITAYVMGLNATQNMQHHDDMEERKKKGGNNK